MGRWKEIGKYLHKIRALLFLLPAAIALLLFFLLPRFPAFTEAVFSGGLFRVLEVPIGFFSSLLPFSLTELLVVLAVPAVVLLLILLIRRLKRSPNRKRTAACAGRAAGSFLSCALLLYMLLHGLNFDRRPAAELMGLDLSPKSPEYLQAVCIDLAQKASAERENLGVDDGGCMKLSQGKSETLKLAGDGYAKLDRQYPFLWGVVNRAKPVALSHWWSYTGITGMYFPFFVEANVNIDQPDSGIPASAAHELAHTRGFAKEDECNFFACLSCFESSSADYRYSGYQMAYVYCSNALYDYSKSMWRTAYAYCSDGVKNDLNEQNKYWGAFEGTAQKAATAVNDSFLKAQGGKGVLSYDQVVGLLLAYYEKEGLVSP